MAQPFENNEHKKTLISKYRPIGIPAVRAASGLCKKTQPEKQQPCRNAGLPKFSKLS